VCPHGETTKKWETDWKKHGKLSGHVETVETVDPGQEFVAPQTLQGLALGQPNARED